MLNLVKVSECIPLLVIAKSCEYPLSLNCYKVSRNCKLIRIGSNHDTDNCMQVIQLKIKFKLMPTNVVQVFIILYKLTYAIQIIHILRSTPIDITRPKLK